jgi:hypothetical protein
MTGAEHSVQESESLAGLGGRIELGDEYPFGIEDSVGRWSSCFLEPIRDVAYFHTAERSRCDGARAGHCR